MRLSFEVSFEIAQRAQTMAFEFSNPALGDFIDRNGVEVMELFAPAPDGRDQICLFEYCEVFRYSLTRHIEFLTQFTQRLSAPCVKPIQQLPPARICERFEHRIHRSN